MVTVGIWLVQGPFKLWQTRSNVKFYQPVTHATSVWEWSKITPGPIVNPSLHYSTFKIIPAPKSHERPRTSQDFLAWYWNVLDNRTFLRTCCESKNSSTSSSMPRFQRKRMKELDSWKERRKGGKKDRKVRNWYSKKEQSQGRKGPGKEKERKGRTKLTKQSQRMIQCLENRVLEDPPSSHMSWTKEKLQTIGLMISIGSNLCLDYWPMIFLAMLAFGWRLGRCSHPMYNFFEGGPH